LLSQFFFRQNRRIPWDCPTSRVDIWRFAHLNDTISVTRAQIRAFSDAIAREFQPRKIVLFGSYAYGRPTPDSDVDLLVIMPFDRKRGRKSLEIRQGIEANFPLDLIVRTPEFIAQRLKWGDCFTAEILAKGDVLYEGPDQGRVEKAEGDFLVATQIMRRLKWRVFDAACFHSRQAIEKYF
jgi:uncharacterized protein